MHSNLKILDNIRVWLLDNKPKNDRKNDSKGDKYADENRSCR